MDWILLPHSFMEQLERTQGTLIKHVWAKVSSLEAQLLQALHLNVQDKVKQRADSLLKHSFIVQSPRKDFSIYF